MLEKIGKWPGHGDSLRGVGYQQPKVNVAWGRFSAGEAAAEPATSHDARGPQTGHDFDEDAAELFAPRGRLSEECDYIVRSQQVNPRLQLTTVAKANL